MKTKVMFSLALSWAFLLAMAIPAPAQMTTQHNMQNMQGSQSSGTHTFMGDIYDSACAQMGSHQQMMKQEHVKTARECTLKCVDSGSKLVLYNRARKMIYQLDDQDKAKQFAGDRVSVRGTYDPPSTKTIHVESIKRG